MVENHIYIINKVEKVKFDHYCTAEKDVMLCLI